MTTKPEAVQADEDDVYDAAPEHSVRIHLAEMMARRNMSLNRLSELTGIHVTNLSKLKNGRVAFIRLATLSVLCEELECQPGDLLTYGDED